MRVHPHAFNYINKKEKRKIKKMVKQIKKIKKKYKVVKRKEEQSRLTNFPQFCFLDKVLKEIE